MPHELPALPYDKAALEPHFDALTMEIHHDRHHKAYVDNLNKAIAGNAALEAKSLEQIIRDLSVVPDAIRGPVRNNGGGHWNHSFFWSILAPGAGGTPFDLAALKPFFLGEGNYLPKPEDFAQYAGFLDARIRYDRVKNLLESIEGFTQAQVNGHELIPGDAVIREFVGGSTVQIPHNE